MQSQETVTVTLTNEKKEFNVAILLDELTKEYARRICNLVGEEEALQKELESLMEKQPQLQAQAEAKVRVLERKYDELIADGKHEKGEALQEKIAEAKADLEKIEQRQAVIYERLQQIEKEKHAEAGRTVAAVYPGIQSACWGMLNAAFSFLNEAWKILEGFSTETGVRISYLNHRNNLRPYNNGKGRALYSKIGEWLTEL
ncbi:MAG: hypothetical protein ABSG75_14545 [Syntrophales bacterium]|jgi:hypothetical protein